MIPATAIGAATPDTVAAAEGVKLDAVIDRGIAKGDVAGASLAEMDEDEMALGDGNAAFPLPTSPRPEACSTVLSRVESGDAIEDGMAALLTLDDGAIS